MDRLLLILLLCVFLIAITRIISEGEWYYAATLILGLLTAREDIRQLWKDNQSSE